MYTRFFTRLQARQRKKAENNQVEGNYFWRISQVNKMHSQLQPTTTNWLEALNSILDIRGVYNLNTLNRLKIETGSSLWCRDKIHFDLIFINCIETADNIRSCFWWVDTFLCLFNAVVTEINQSSKHQTNWLDLAGYGWEKKDLDSVCIAYAVLVWHCTTIAIVVTQLNLIAKSYVGFSPEIRKTQNPKHKKDNKQADKQH